VDDHQLTLCDENCGNERTAQHQLHYEGGGASYFPKVRNRRFWLAGNHVAYSMATEHDLVRTAGDLTEQWEKFLTKTMSDDHP